METVGQCAASPSEAEHGSRLAAGVALPVTSGLYQAQGAQLTDPGKYLFARVSARRSYLQ